jgi:hypothetical protein
MESSHQTGAEEMSKTKKPQKADQPPPVAYEWWGPRSLYDMTPVRRITAEHPSEDGSLWFGYMGITPLYPPMAREPDHE